MYIVHHVKWLQFMVNGLIPFRLNSYAHHKNVLHLTQKSYEDMLGSNGENGDAVAADVEKG